MRNMNLDYHKAIYVVTITSILFSSSGLHAQEKPPVSKTVTEKTKEFLSDPSRTGSLLGSIIAGAAVPNPLAPLVGSVAGFVIGKSSAFSKTDNNTARQNAYNNRSLIPDDGSQVTGLAGLTGNQSQASDQTLQVQASDQSLLQAQASEQTLLQPQTPEPALLQPQVSKHTLLLGSTGATETAVPSEQTQPVVIVPSTVETGAPRSNLREQIAHACSNVQLTQPQSLSCYYYSSE